MKTIKFSLLTLCILLCLKNYGQTYSAANGGVFTPKKDLKILLIFVNFENDSIYHEEWPADQDAPNWATDGSFVFDDLNDFNNIPANNRSLSNYYYEMTKHVPDSDRFKLYSGYLSVEIDVSGADTLNRWWTLRERALDSLESKYADIESLLHSYDNRTNSPNYKSDYSTSIADSIVDYAIMFFRYKAGADNLQPDTNMHNWFGSGGGSASISYKDFGSIKIIYGHTAYNGIHADVKLNTHEIGHKLYNAPHYGGENSVLGNYFSTNTFWGMLPDGDNEIYACANAWERWYLGWIDIKYDLDNSTQNGNYVIRDYMTTGDAIRLKMPYVDNEYIWIENHQGENIFERRMIQDDSICYTALPDPPTGIMVYLEKINHINSSSNSTEFSIFTSGANGIKHFNANGNYDFNVLDSTFSADWWCGNLLYNHEKLDENPFSGYSLSSRSFSDINYNDSLDWKLTSNLGIGTGPGKDLQFIRWVNDTMTYGSTGINSGFQVGDKIGISTNPAITNFQSYGTATKELSPIYLNGISIEVLSKNASGDITLHIEFDDYEIENDLRMCGNVILPPDTINIIQDKTIAINKSGTPNRHTIIDGDFINPTIVSTSKNTYLKLNENSAINVSGKTALIIDDSSTVELNNNSKIVIESGSTLQIKRNANVILQGETSSIEIKEGAYICIDSSNIHLDNALNVIKLHSGLHLGVNTDVLDNPGNCMSSVIIPFTGEGSICFFGYNVYIQDSTISSNKYITGDNIYFGTDVGAAKDKGPVLIEDDARVIIQAEGDIYLEGDTEIEPGAEFEIIKND